jgi:formate-dependent nitrite reductase membrane component NrfD
MPIAIANVQQFQEDPNNPGSPLLYLSVFLVRPGAVQGVSVNVPFLVTDTAAVLATKVTTIIVAAAASVGVTIARTDVLLPSFVRGS